MSTPDIRGVWGTVLLPIGADEGIAWSALETQIDRYLDSGVHGLYSNGTACEFFSQSAAEFEQLSKLLAAKCTAAGRPFQIGCSHMDAWITLDRVKVARELAPTAIQVILPDWVPPSANDQIRFLERVAKAASPVPLVLYCPPHAKVRPTPAELRALADRVPALVGFKLPGGDAAWHRAMRESIGHLSVFVPGHALATGIASGAAGSYSNIAALNPKAARLWYEQILEDPPTARAVEARLQAFLRDHIEPLRDRLELSNPALDKLLCHIGGWTPMPLTLRWPYAGAPPDAVAAIRRAAEQTLPDFVVPPIH